MSPSQVGILLALWSLDDSLASVGAKETSQSKGLGSEVAFMGMRKKAGRDSLQSRDRWDLRDQSGRAGLEETRSFQPVGDL